MRNQAMQRTELRPVVDFRRWVACDLKTKSDKEEMEAG